ncbi:alpha/beta-hydrolase [Aureobasidium pullulans]|uniref:Carboxylic ester hydrolase n=1 Tax=Aureobasidium pullulans TaxID=5580 RepID=A0A4S9PTB7_AURPU|nr:alpha/beta-hydrolase [Aureobasidium pullulans]THZ44808.1 alpha/beta-hydrolase [Aureobasidium pullulans]THZ60743.1 alpha/beta-hydrolase [Aureobasidium pullulans]THZ91673.1 alpha/beta-hydrolase [Aureobasidium pullulans]
MKTVTLLAVAFASVFCVSALSSKISLDYATYQGTAGFDGITRFLGMQYAAPPVGDLRWKAPQDPAQTTAGQSAAKFKDVCIGVKQTVGTGPIGGFTYGEDCLYISVITPSSATNTSHLPVLFHIPGGGFAQLADPNLDFTDFVKTSGNNIVAVQINYRVGGLGFLAGEEVRSGGALNAGLLDQRKALQWVRKYISQFGGDPNRVTIFGGSAGAGSVGLQMTAYGGRDDGLFAGAYADAPAYSEVNSDSYSQFQFNNFATAAGCGSATDRLSCLRQADIAKIQKANVVGNYTDIAAQFTFNPVIDGTFVQDIPLRLFQTGHFVNVPMIVGDATDEGTLFAANAGSPEEVSEFMQANVPSLTEANLTTINQFYPLMAAQQPFHKAYAVGASNQVWNYRFDQSSLALRLAGHGVLHAFDTGAIFGPNAGPMAGLLGIVENGLVFSSFANENADVVPIMMNYAISFVRTQDPNTYKSVLAPDWQTYNNNGGKQRIVVRNSGVIYEDVPAAQQTRCAFWTEIIANSFAE